MEKILIFLVFLTSCTVPAKFVVTEKNPNGVFDNCVATIKPLNKPAIRMKSTQALVGCGEEQIGDTITITKKTLDPYVKKL